MEVGIQWSGPCPSWDTDPTSEDTRPSPYLKSLSSTQHRGNGLPRPSSDLRPTSSAVCDGRRPPGKGSSPSLRLTYGVPSGNSFFPNPWSPSCTTKERGPGSSLREILLGPVQSWILRVFYGRTRSSGQDVEYRTPRGRRSYRSNGSTH